MAGTSAKRVFALDVPGIHASGPCGFRAPNPPLNSPRVRGLKRACSPAYFAPQGFQPGRIEPMARRFSAPYQSEPVSSLASWARNLAVFAAVAVVVSILIVRFGFLEVKPALATFFGALACAGLAILVGLAAFVAIWQNGSRGMRRHLVALLNDAGGAAHPGCSGPPHH